MLALIIVLAAVGYGIFDTVYDTVSDQYYGLLKNDQGVMFENVYFNERVYVGFNDELVLFPAGN